MNLCIGERIDAPGWTGLPLGRFAPPGHDSALPVAAAQDTLFVWKDGASAARVRVRRELRHYERRAGVVDVMARDEQAFVAHDDPQAPGECLLVAVPPGERRRFCADRDADGCLDSHFGLADPLLHALALALERQCRELEPLGRLGTESLSATLVTCLLARHAEDRGAGAPLTSRRAPGALSTAQMRRVHRHLEERLAHNLGLGELAALVGYSPAHFLRLFRRSFGCTPHQYLLDLRIAQAKRLLRADGQSLAEIAGACGFAHQSHFGAAFARRAGVSPGRFRTGSGD